MYLKQITNPEGFRSDEVDLVDMVMPLYLSEELAPRFARLKKYKAYKTRREAEEIERSVIGRSAVNEWESQGRDRGLKEAMDLEEVGLEGVYIKHRTRKEVRDAAVDEFDVDNEVVRGEVNMAVREGKIWDTAVGDWVDGPKALKIQRKRERRERKREKELEKLQNLSL